MNLVRRASGVFYGISAEHFRRFLIALIATAALLQWSVVLERTWAAAWAWYKFDGYGGGGHIVVGRTTQIVFLLGSGVLAAVGYALFRAESTGGSGLWRGVSRFGWLSITLCTLFWIALLVSPLVTFQRT
jgi:hypothetical protein